MKPVEWLSSEDAARYLGFTKDDGTVNLLAFTRWRQRNPLKTYRLGKRLLRFKRVDLDRQIETVGK